MHEASSNPPVAATGRRSRFWLWITAGLFLLLIGIIAYTVLHLPPASTPALPNPNGYDDLVRAGKGILGDPPDTTNRVELGLFLERSRRSLALARRGLREPCRVPIAYTNPVAWMGTRLPELAALKRLALTIDCEARLDGVEHRFNAAVTNCLDCIRLGQQVSRGGLLIDRLVGFAIEYIGLAELGKLARRLNAHTRQDSYRALATLETEQDPLSVALAAERDWQKRTFSGWQRLAALLNYRQERSVERSFASKDLKIRRLFRQVLRQLAASSKPTKRAANASPPP